MSGLGMTGALNRIAGTSELGEEGAANAAVTRIDGLSAATGSSFLPTGALAATHNRYGAGLANSNAISVSGGLRLNAIDLPEGLTITSISFMSATTAANGPTNQWFALYDSSLNLLRQTEDDTTTAWGSNAVKTLDLTSTFTTTYSGLHYVGICVVTSTTQPTLYVSVGATVVNTIPPILSGLSTTGLTDTAPAVADALTPSSQQPWAYVS